MATTLLLILLSVFIVSLISFVSAITLFTHKKLDEILNYLVCFAAGGLLGAAFLDLLPEASKFPHDNVFLLALAGLLAFFLVELYFHWHHHHAHIKGENKHMHAVGYLNLIGDGVHNFIDGMIIAASFLVSTPLGIVTTIAVIAHEIPQEIGDFGILVYSGFSKGKALLFNFLTALTAVAGALLAYFASNLMQNFIYLLIPFAAGSFIYIAAADLLPEIHKHRGNKIESLGQIALLFSGIILIWGIGKVFA